MRTQFTVSDQLVTPSVTIDLRMDSDGKIGIQLTRNGFPDCYMDFQTPDELDDMLRLYDKVAKHRLALVPIHGGSPYVDRVNNTHTPRAHTP